MRCVLPSFPHNRTDNATNHSRNGRSIAARHMNLRICTACSFHYCLFPACVRASCFGPAANRPVHEFIVCILSVRVPPKRFFPGDSLRVLRANNMASLFQPVARRRRVIDTAPVELFVRARLSSSRNVT